MYLHYRRFGVTYVVLIYISGGCVAVDEFQFVSMYYIIYLRRVYNFFFLFIFFFLFLFDEKIFYKTRVWRKYIHETESSHYSV